MIDPSNLRNGDIIHVQMHVVDQTMGGKSLICEIANRSDKIIVPMSEIVEVAEQPLKAGDIVKGRWSIPCKIQAIYGRFAWVNWPSEETDGHNTEGFIVPLDELALVAS